MIGCSILVVLREEGEEVFDGCDPTRILDNCGSDHGGRGAINETQSLQIESVSPTEGGEKMAFGLAPIQLESFLTSPVHTRAMQASRSDVEQVADAMCTN